MDSSTYLTLVARDGARLRATDPADLGRTVPSCPAWNVGQLLGHVGWVYRWVSATLLADPEQPPHPKSIERAPEGDAVIGWFGEALDGLLAAFAGADLDQTRNTFIGPRPGHWWARRIAHETCMHLWDAEAATGGSEPIETEMAIDGLDEALQTYVASRFKLEAFGATGESLHLHATDGEGEGEGEWMLTMGPERLDIAAGHGKATTALRGRAEDLLLFVMSRRGTEGLEIFGDAELPARWQAAANF